MTFEEFLMEKVAAVVEEKLAALGGIKKRRKKKQETPTHRLRNLVTMGGFSAGGALASSIFDDIKEHSMAPLKARLYSLAKHIGRRV